MISWSNFFLFSTAFFCIMAAAAFAVAAGAPTFAFFFLALFSFLRDYLL
jgi:hypothetical protein